jgi:hypothetical protein
MSALQRFVSLALCAAALLVLPACEPKLPAMTPEETERMTPLLSKMVTRCVGRYLLDVPEALELNPVMWVKIEDVDFKTARMSRTVFDVTVEQRQKWLAEQTLYGKPTRTLNATLPLLGGAGVVFDRAKSGASNYYREFELRGYRDGVAFEMTVGHVNGNLDDRDPDPTDNTGPTQLAKLLELWARISARRDDQMATGQGLCIPNGFISGAPTDQEELMTYYSVKSADNGQIDFEQFSTIGPEKETLLGRSSEMKKRQAARNGRLIRSGVRASEGLGQEFEEWLEMLPRRESGTTTFNFISEMNSRIGRAKAPLVRVAMHAGRPIARPEESLDAEASRPPITKPIFSEAEMLALWDAVLPTLRKRPGAF